MDRHGAQQRSRSLYLRKITRGGKIYIVKNIKTEKQNKKKKKKKEKKNTRYRQDKRHTYKLTCTVVQRFRAED